MISLGATSDRYKNQGTQLQISWMDRIIMTHDQIMLSSQHPQTKEWPGIDLSLRIFQRRATRRGVSVPPYHRLRLLPAHRLHYCWYRRAMTAERPITTSQPQGIKWCELGISIHCTKVLHYISYGYRYVWLFTNIPNPAEYALLVDSKLAFKMITSPQTSTPCTIPHWCAEELRRMKLTHDIFWNTHEEEQSHRWKFRV